MKMFWILISWKKNIQITDFINEECSYVQHSSHIQRNGFTWDMNFTKTFQRTKIRENVALCNTAVKVRAGDSQQHEWSWI